MDTSAKMEATAKVAHRPLRYMHSSTFDYLAPTPDQIQTMSVLRTGFRSLCDLAERMIPEGRYKDLTINALEEAAMWANKGITRDSDGSPRIKP